MHGYGEGDMSEFTSESVRTYAMAREIGHMRGDEHRKGCASGRAESGRATAKTQIKGREQEQVGAGMGASASASDDMRAWAIMCGQVTNGSAGACACAGVRA